MTSRHAVAAYAAPAFRDTPVHSRLRFTQLEAALPVMAQIESIEHLGRIWDIAPLGTGFGVAAGYVPEPDRWTVAFEAVADTSTRYRGYIGRADPGSVPVDHLKRALEYAVLPANLGVETWDTVDTLSDKTGIAPERIRSVLDGHGDIVDRWQGRVGPPATKMAD